MEQGIALVHQRQVGAPDDDPRVLRHHIDLPGSQWIGDKTDDLALADFSAQRHQHPQNPAFGRPQPGGGLADHRRLVVSPPLAQHAQVAHHVDDPLFPGANIDFVETQGLAGLIQDHRHPQVRGALPQGAVPDLGVDRQWRAEGLGDGQGFGVVQVGANLREVAAVAGAGVQVDTVGGVGDNLRHKGVGYAAGQGAAGRAGEGAIEVAAVGQVAGVVDKTVDIDDGNGDQRALEPVHQGVFQQAADDLHAIDLVAVDGGAHKQLRAGQLAAHDLYADGQRVVGIGRRHRDFDIGALARQYLLPADDQPVHFLLGHYCSRIKVVAIFWRAWNRPDRSARDRPGNGRAWRCVPATS